LGFGSAADLIHLCSAISLTFLHKTIGKVRTLNFGSFLLICLTSVVVGVASGTEEANELTLRLRNQEGSETEEARRSEELLLEILVSSNGSEVIGLSEELFSFYDQAEEGGPGTFSNFNEVGNGSYLIKYRTNSELVSAHVYVLIVTVMLPDGNITEDIYLLVEAHPPIGTLLVGLFAIFLGAKLAAEVFERIRQPPVIGELLVGIIIGNTVLKTWLQLEHAELVLEVLAELGVIFLIFLIGLETRVSDMAKVGKVASLVGAMGVIFPFLLGVGFIVTKGGYEFSTALFVGAAMVATSVGITARVLVDLNQQKSNETRIILGAAVIDDVLGLIILSVVGALAVGEARSTLDIAMGVIYAGLFIAVIVMVGPRFFRWMSGEKTLNGVQSFEPGEDRFNRFFLQKRVVFMIAIITCLGLAAAAASLGLAAIIGAFFAGMAFADVAHHHKLEKQFEPIHDLLVPFFFVFIGLSVNIYAFLDREIAILTMIIVVLAVIGKLVGCGLAALSLGKNSALIVGVGMVPRGEVGIIVANVGFAAGLIDDVLFSVIVMMSIITTLIAPPLLKVGFARKLAEEEKTDGGTDE